MIIIFIFSILFRFYFWIYFWIRLSPLTILRTNTFIRILYFINMRLKLIFNFTFKQLYFVLSVKIFSSSIISRWFFENRSSLWQFFFNIYTRLHIIIEINLLLLLILFMILTFITQIVKIWFLVSAIKKGSSCAFNLL